MFHRIVIAVCAAAWMWAASAALAQPQPARIALVVTNQAYTQPGARLTNTHRDGDIIKAALEKVGFRVTVVRDTPNEGALLAAIAEHVARLSAAGPDAVGFLYYSGHGAADRPNGENYLIPTSAPLTHVNQLPLLAVKLEKITEALAKAGRMSFVVFDACRNVPLQRDDKSPFKGFAPVREQSGLLVAFATEPGNVAVDQSLYARALSEEMVRPGQEAGAVFRRVRLKVREDTNRQQSPEYLDKRDHDFQFAAAQSSEPQGSGAAEVVRLCREISGITSPATLAALERQHKGTPVADCISARMGELQAAEAANKQAAAKADEQARADAAKRKADEDAKARADAERQRVALLAKQEEERKRAEAGSAQPVGRGPEKTKLYAVTFAPGGKLETPPYTGGTIRRDYAGYAGTLVRDDRGIFEIKVTDVNLAGQDGLRHECTGGAALAAIKVGAIVRMKPSNCTTLTDYFVAGAAFETATASVMPAASAAAATASADAAAAATPGSGKSFRDCPDCPEMVVVPAGSFMMGSPDSEQGRGSSEGPQRRVMFAKPFAVGKFEVTFAEWDACVSDGGCKHQPETGAGRGRQPVHSVSWNDAQEFVEWLSKKTGKTYRLLTEAEWEYAARAGTTTPFSFGETISTDQANYNGNITYSSGRKGVYRQKTIEVGSLNKPNAWGLHDMHGNVWEWVQDCHSSYSGAPTDGRTASDSAGCARVLRGGSWSSSPQILRSSYRQILVTA